MLTNQQCQEIWESDQKIVVDTPEGKQVMDWVREQNKLKGKECDLYGGIPVFGSFTAFTSILDGKEISSSKQLAEHNRRYGVEQVGDEFKNKRKESAEGDAAERASAAQQAAKDAEIMNTPEIKKQVENFINRRVD